MAFAVRAQFAWFLRNRTLQLGGRTLVMGILNVTPDSFSDGGAWLEAKTAVSHGLRMLDEGADIVDVGGESTRPNAAPLEPAEEQARAMPVLRGILEARPDAIVSIDTYHCATARAAVQAGAEIVNDVSGHLWDPEMAAACAEWRCGAILMHTRGRPPEWRGLPRLPPAEVVPLVRGELDAGAQTALKAGVAREAIVLDPGFGFGKSFEENYRLLAGMDALRSLGFPLLAGVSRKGFLRQSGTTDEALEDATTAANAAAILAGAHILRVHDVSRARAAVSVADRILAASGAE